MQTRFHMASAFEKNKSEIAAVEEPILSQDERAPRIERF